MQLEVLGHHVPVTTELHMCHLRHLCILCSILKDLGSEGRSFYQSTFEGIECNVVT